MMTEKNLSPKTENKINMRISPNILDEMSGRVSVKTLEDKSDEIILEIPFDIYDANGELKSKAEPKPDFDFTGVRALLVSNDDKCRNRTSELLALVNIKSDWVPDMSTALEQLNKTFIGDYQLIFVNTSNLNRQLYRFAEKIHKTKGKSIGLFAITDEPTPKALIQDVNTGIAAYFIKPVDSRALYYRLSKYLKKQS